MDEGADGKAYGGKAFGDAMRRGMAQTDFFDAMGQAMESEFGSKTGAGEEGLGECAKMLEAALGAGADPNLPIPGAEGSETALMIAAQRGWDGVCRSLLAAGADAALGDDDGHTALMKAAMWGMVDAVVVLSKCPGLMARAKTGSSAIVVAAENGAAECVDAIAGALLSSVPNEELASELDRAMVAARGVSGIYAPAEDAVEALGPWVELARDRMELAKASRPGAGAKPAPRL